MNTSPFNRSCTWSNVYPTKMGFERWFLLCGVCLVLASETSFKGVEWRGSLTKVDETGITANLGLVTRCQFFRNNVFMAIPRLKRNSGGTLVKMTLPQNPPKNATTENPKMELFPPSTPQTEGDCKCLQSVVDLFLDSSHILWALDVGTVECTPKVLGFNASTGKVEHDISLACLVEPHSRFQFVVADYDKDGKCYLYVSDAGAMSIVVWDVKNMVGRRLSLPDHVVFEHALKDVLYLALVGENENTRLYYTYRSSDKLLSVDTRQLQHQNGDLCTSKQVSKEYQKFIILGTDGLNSLFLRYETHPCVYKWKTDTPFKPDKLELVHSGTGLTPTQVMPYRPKGDMVLCESNLSEYLHPHAKQCDSFNRLTVMSLA